MKTLTIIITYKPDPSTLKRLISSLNSQILSDKITNDILIVDNNSININNILPFANKNIGITQLNENKGIAYAQNIGLKKALDENYDYAMLSDQDTAYPSNYISTIVPHIDHGVAAIGSMFIDTNLNRLSGFIQKIDYGTWKIEQPINGTYEVKQLIASGKIINLSCIRDIGLMMENLFIDYVDLEWCWRARSKNHKVLINADINLSHKLGDAKANISNNRSYALRSSKRYYFLVRNGIYLSIYNPKNILTPKERFVIFTKSIGYSIVYSSNKPRLKNTKYCTKGFFHGLIKKLGNPL